MRDLTFDIRGRDKTQGAFDSARRNARAFNSDLDRTGVGMRVAAAAAKAFVAAFTITAVANFGRVVRETVGEASALAKMADKVGVTTDEIQKMIFGFGQAGVASTDIERNLEQWSKRVSEANFFGSRLGDIFAANNVSLTDQNGKLRGSTELLRQLAELIKNAATDQERMTIATEAFGRSGGDMVLALRNGAAGMDELMRRTEAAGGVIEEELLRKAEEIDDEFDAMWRRFEIASKSAILNAVSWLDQLSDKFGELQQERKDAQAAAVLGAQMGGLAGARLPERRGRIPSPADRRIDDAFANPGEEPDVATVAALQRKFGTPTIIPETEERKKSTKAAKEQVSAYERVMQALQHEQQLLGLSDTAQRVLNEQRRASVDATSAQGQAIARLVTQIEAENERLKALEDRQMAVNEAFGYLAASGLDAMFAWADGAATAEEALKRMGLEILRAVAYGALLGSGPFGNLFGGGLLGGFRGGRASGGPVDPFGTYLVGEKGPELLRMGASGGSVVSNSDAFGGAGGPGGSNVYHIDARGAQRGVGEEIRAALEAYDRGRLGRLATDLPELRRRGAA